MNLNLLAALLVFSAINLAAADDSQPNLPETFVITPGQVFAPQGFDNNDNAQITISGMMPNTCWKTGPSTAKVDANRKQIVIQNQNYFYGDCWCLEVLVPYTKTIELGVVPAGNYEIMAEQHDGKLISEGKMAISASKNRGPDDHLYAQVENIVLDPAQAGGPKRLTLTGTLAATCMELGEVKVQYGTNEVIEVLPIVKIVNETTCDPKPRHFSTEVMLRPTWKGDTLIHVRSLNGQAINKVVRF